ncbi:terminase small subunit [Levilactobacillus acidifarinae]|uniref:terminase small subunit n=1 Tax=Levilactobacillus acidifarinae TaxID=267364 RepID=UPI0007111B87|nr:terminase small subunit [Levilactobacillus acidifarinae]GEO70527.1 phage terminase small subunit [Levilactobacillus acidifarinae]
MTDKQKQVYEDYMLGMSYADIADKHDISVNTFKSWKRRNGWQRGAPQKKKVHPKSKGAPKQIPEAVKELEANSELTEKQKLFCLFYLQDFNATQAYMRAYKSGWKTANVNGSGLLAKTSVKKQLAELKEQQKADLYVTAEDIAQGYAKQAFASLGDVIDYKVHTELVTDSDGNVLLDTNDKPIKKHVSDIYLKPSDQIDWSLVQEVHRGKDGLVVKLFDNQRAKAELMKYLKDNKADGDDVTINLIRSDRRNKDGNQRESGQSD